MTGLITVAQSFAAHHRVSTIVGVTTGVDMIAVVMTAMIAVTEAIGVMDVEMIVLFATTSMEDRLFTIDDKKEGALPSFFLCPTCLPMAVMTKHLNVDL